jgi:hypothetical protein
MPVGDVYRVNIIQAFKGNRMITGFHARALSISASQDDLGNDVVANETIEHTITGNLVGEFVSPSAPPQVAAVLSIHSGSKGKRKRGRMYIGGLPAEFVGAGTISGQLLTNLQVFADTLKNRYTLTGTSRNTSYEMVVWSPAAPDFINKKGVHTRLTDLITGVSKLTVDLTTRTQRRRELGVGA